MSDDTNGENFHRENGNIKDLMNSKGISDTSSTTALHRTRSIVSNGNIRMGRGRVI